MSAPEPNTGKEGFLPNDRTIALASSILLSKPEQLCIGEYIELLRQHVAKCRRADTLSSSHRHLDRSSMWRSEYERMRSAYKEAEEQLAKLKAENDKLKQEVGKPRPANPAKKRKKAPDEDVLLVPRSPKRQKQNPSFSGSGLSYVQVAMSIDLSDMEEIGHVLVRVLGNVQSQIKRHRAIDTSAFAQTLARAAAVVPEMIQKFITENDTAEEINDYQLKTTLNAADRSVRLLLAGIQRLSQSRNSVGATGYVTYAYVQMYSNLLECLDAMAALEVGKAETEVNATIKSKAYPSKSRAKPQKQPIIKDSTNVNLVTRLLCSVIDALDSKSDAHKSLFEGFAYVVLKRLGSTLYLLVFGHARGASIADEIAAYNEVDEIEDTPNDSPTRSRADLLKPAKLEAPYLIHLLTRIMNAAPAHLDALAVTKSGSPKKAVRGSMKGAIAIDARERLQRTLLECMFGEDGGEDDEFHDCLRMPAMKDAPVPMPKIKEPEVQEWYKEEVWRLLGWEILSREIEV